TVSSIPSRCAALFRGRALPRTTISSTRSPNSAAPILATLGNGPMTSPLAPRARILISRADGHADLAPLNTITRGITWQEDLKSQKDELMCKCLLDDIPAARAFLDEADVLRRDREHFGAPDESPACKVVTRYLYQVFRNTPRESVFAQALFGFELASIDPCVAGINLVGSEDNFAAMADYADHMRIFQFVRGLYP